MARIELRHATVRLVDGYTNTAAVNDTPVAGDTNLDIDTVVSVDTDGEGNMSTIIPVSTRFTVAGSTKVYTVTGQDANAQLDIDVDTASAGTFTVTIGANTSAGISYDASASVAQAAIDLITGVEEGDFVVTKPTATTFRVKAVATGAYGNEAVTMSGNVASLTGGGAASAVQTHAGGSTWNLTFTPALATADGIPADSAVMMFTGRTLEIKIGDGNAEYTENRAFLYDLDRGELDTVRQDADVPMDVSIDFVWEFLTAISGAETPTISDVLHRRGPAASWKSAASDDTCAPFCIDIEIEYAPPCGGANTEFITLPEFRWESLPHSLTDAQVSMTGKCNSTEALISRGAA